MILDNRICSLTLAITGNKKRSNEGAPLSLNNKLKQLFLEQQLLR